MQKDVHPADMPKRHPQSLNEADAAAYIGSSRDYMKKKRRFGGGPPFIRIGRMIRYRVDDLDRWLEAHLVGKQSDRAS